MSTGKPNTYRARYYATGRFSKEIILDPLQHRAPGEKETLVSGIASSRGHSSVCCRNPEPVAVALLPWFKF